MEHGLFWLGFWIFFSTLAFAGKLSVLSATCF